MGCIYRATNKINGKSYIGQTIRNLYDRKSDHHLQAEKRLDNMPFHRAIQKYGRESFIWEYVHNNINDIYELNRLEVEAISTYNTLAPNGYNLQYGGNNGFHHEDTKKKMSIAHRGRVYKPHECGPLSIRSIVVHSRMAKHYKPMTHTDMIRMVNGESKRGSLRMAMYDAIHLDPSYNTKKHDHYSKAQKERLSSPLYIEKMRVIWDTTKGNESSKAIRCIETNDTYCSIREASRALGMDRRDMRRIMGSKNKTYKGLHYIYIAPTLDICVHWGR